MTAPDSSFGLIPLPDGPFIIAVDDNSPLPEPGDDDRSAIAEDIAAELHRQGRGDAIVFVNLSPAIVCDVCSAKVHDLDKHKAWHATLFTMEESWRDINVREERT